MNIYNISCVTEVFRLYIFIELETLWVAHWATSDAGIYGGVSFYKIETCTIREADDGRSSST